MAVLKSKLIFVIMLYFYSNYSYELDFCFTSMTKTSNKYH